MTKGFAPCFAERLGLSVGAAFALFPLRLRLPYCHGYTTRDHPGLSITSVAHDRLPVFRTDAPKKVVGAALQEARPAGGFAILAYVVTPDHLHVVTDGRSTTNRYFRIWTRSCGGSRDDAAARRSLTAETTRENREDSPGKAEPFRKAGGGAENNTSVAR